MMNKDFVPHPEALELKELGFDEDSFGYYDTEGLQIRYDFLNTTNKNSLFTEIRITNNPKISAPTFSQAFRWFREKYDLNAISPTRIYATDDYLCTIIDWNNWSQIHFPEGLSISYEESELKCLKKLIEIVKNKQ